MNPHDRERHDNLVKCRRGFALILRTTRDYGPLRSRYEYGGRKYHNLMRIVNRGYTRKYYNTYKLLERIAANYVRLDDISNGIGYTRRIFALLGAIYLRRYVGNFYIQDHGHNVRLLTLINVLYKTYDKFRTRNVNEVDIRDAYDPILCRHCRVKFVDEMRDFCNECSLCLICNEPHLKIRYINEECGTYTYTYECVKCNNIDTVGEFTVYEGDLNYDLIEEEYERRAHRVITYDA